MTKDLDTDLSQLIARALARLQKAGIAVDDDLAVRAKLSQMTIVSDFAIDTLVQQPTLLAQLDLRAASCPHLAPEQEQNWPTLLRHWRSAESTRLIWRDVMGLDSVQDTLAGSSTIAEQALEAGLTAVSSVVAQRHGDIIKSDGQAQTLLVLGLGKLGGGELNFSSDIDLIYAFAEHGQSNGAHALDAEAYFTRIGQRLTQLLGEITAAGFCHRVDLRLRPFGASGRMALSFSAMEQYYQREGRDWERYAWIKARPVAGDMEGGKRLLNELRPFVYRRYLDYSALDGLREMKALIDAEVKKRELSDHIKLGPGGIREIEFLVQALQLIRGGREPELRQRALLPALTALADAGHLPEATAQELTSAYLFLRRLENRLQMLSDQQTHVLPDNTVLRHRIAIGLGFADYVAFLRQLDDHRAVVSEAFAGLLQNRRRRLELSVVARYWKGLPDEGEVSVLTEAGFVDAEQHHIRLRDFARSSAVRDLSERARQRLDHVLPALVEASARSSAPDAALPRGLALMQAITRRTSYLALLEEQPAALTRLVDVTARSALLSERLAAHPLLLDELLDTRAAGAVPDDAMIATQLALLEPVLQQDDAESALAALNELRQSLSFRIALVTLAQRQPAIASARQLALLADGLVRAALVLARRQMQLAHGEIEGAGFAIIGYGSVGGRELGFGSDLDLVFLHDAPPEAVSNGTRPLELARYMARLAQKFIALLGTATAAGRLYEVDMRLRPDGAKGLLVSSVASFADYQHQRAWTWEQQALVRARPLAGDAGVCAAFSETRRAVLMRARNPDALRADVKAMRQRMRSELDRSHGHLFDLKQGEGGLVDLEFLLQAKVLALSATQPTLYNHTDTPSLLQQLLAMDALGEDDVESLPQAHQVLLSRGLDCTLDQRPRICPEDDAILAARQTVRHCCSANGLDFTENSSE